MNTLDLHDPARPWYREFWVWFVIALPLSVVVAGISTAFIAINGADSLVVDDFQKVGLVARRSGVQEKRAAQLGISTMIAVDRDSGQVTVRLQGEANPSQLQIGLFHPTQPSMDRAGVLARDNSGLYRGNIGGGVHGHWHLRLGDIENGWRIAGILSATQQLLELSVHDQ